MGPEDAWQGQRVRGLAHKVIVHSAVSIGCADSLQGEVPKDQEVEAGELASCLEAVVRAGGWLRSGSDSVKDQNFLAHT
jgi:hypothetical protein